MESADRWPLSYPERLGTGSRQLHGDPRAVLLAGLARSVHRVFSAAVHRPAHRGPPEGWPTLHGMAFDQGRCLCRDYAGERETGVRQKRAEIRFRTLATADH
jgi:hypothetical protein